MKMKFLFCLIFIVSACGSAPKLKTQYFVLTPNIEAPSDNKQNTSQDGKKFVALQPIKIAEYLDQPGIVLQTDNHKIEIAHYHRWGEPLKRNLHRYILETLTAQLPQHVFQNESNLSQTTPDQYIEIVINQFNGTTGGSALLSGFWLINNTDTTTFKQSFSYHSPLSSSGYPELVNTLASLLDQLCKDIANSTKNNE